jgi:uncharacterized protein
MHRSLQILWLTVWVVVVVVVAVLDRCVEASTTTKTTTQRRRFQEPRTGIEFDPIVQNLSLEKLGVRTKGPIKVYAVGQYGKSSRTGNNNNNGKLNLAFVLKMSMNVSREKLSSALMDALEPRCQKFGCEANTNVEFRDMVLQGLPLEGAKSGTTLIFNTSGNKVSLTVNNKRKGKIVGKAVAKAFAAIYTDNKAVCTMNPVVKKEEEENKKNQDSSHSFFKDKNIAGIVTTFVAILVTVWSMYSDSSGSATFIVSELNIYPIKSCAEQVVESAVVTPRGFRGDRIAMVVDSNNVCCTSRDVDKVKLFHVQPKINFPTCNTMTVSYKGGENSLSSLTVDLENTTFPSVTCRHNEAPGKLVLSDLGNTAASWIGKVTGIVGCRLTRILDDDDNQRECLINPSQGDPIPTLDGKAPVSLADEAPFLLTNQSSLDDLNQRLIKRGHVPVDMRRFRPNIVVKNATDMDDNDNKDQGGILPWIEDTWKKIRIGTVEFFVWQRCGRCIMTTIDRDSLSRTSHGEPLSTLNTIWETGEQGQGRNFGVHLIPDPATLLGNKDDDDDGSSSKLTVCVGHTIEVLEYDTDRYHEWKEKFSR